MPNIITPLSDLESSVERPVIYDILRQMMDITRISSQTPIRFYGDAGKATQQNSTITDNGLGENIWDFDERLIIEVDQDYDKDHILVTAVTVPEHLLIFRDDALGVIIKPVYMTTDVSIRAKYRARDRNQANRWRNDMVAHTAKGRDVNLHTVQYSYHIPDAFVILLQELHRLRENLAGHGENFNDYFTGHLTTNASVVTNLAGKEAVWAISEPQMGIQTWFEIEGVPEKPDKDGDHDTWTTSFTYRFRYEKPIECNMVYPIVVHNQVLSTNYRPDRKVDRRQEHQRSYTFSGAAYNQFESDTDALLYRGSTGLLIPNFDEFMPNSIPSATLRVFSALTTISSPDERDLLNLKELPDLQLDRDILEFMTQSEYPFMGKNYASIFSLNLYCGPYLQESGSLQVLPDLTVRATKNLDLRKTYRVRLSLVGNFAYTYPAALQRLKEFPAAAAKLALALNAALRDCGAESDLLKNKLSATDLAAIGLNETGKGEFDALPLKPAAGSPNDETHWKLAQILFVSTASATDGIDNNPNRAYGKTQ